MTPTRNTAAKKEKFWIKYKIQIASSVFAIIIWFFIVTGGIYDYTAKIPISIVREYQQFVITSPIPSHALVHLRGHGRYLLTFLIFKQARLLLNLKEDSGDKIIHPAPENVQLLGNAKKLAVVDIEEPTAIPITIEKMAHHKIPIKLNIKIKPLAGHIIMGEVLLDPSFTTIYGPQSKISGYDSIETIAEVWKDLKRPFQRQVDLLPPSEPFIQLADQKVSVSGDIQKLMEKKISQIPVNVINLPPHTEAAVIPPFISLVIEGGIDAVAPITAKDIKVYIDYQRQQPSQDQYYLAVIEDIPGVRPRDFNPKRFRLALEIDQDR